MADKVATKKLKDFPPSVLEALIETLEEKCPVPDAMKAILTDADKWELAKQQGRRSVLDDVKGSLTVMRKHSKKQPAAEGLP